MRSGSFQYLATDPYPIDHPFWLGWAIGQTGKRFDNWWLNDAFKKLLIGEPTPTWWCSEHDVVKTRCDCA